MLLVPGIFDCQKRRIFKRCGRPYHKGDFPFGSYPGAQKMKMLTSYTNHTCRSGCRMSQPGFKIVGKSFLVLISGKRNLM
jgi:hypothetical protein